VYTFLVIVHVIVSIILMLVIIMQSSKGGGLSGTFGGSGGSLFGSRTAATFLSKLTTSFAIAFMVISILITLISVPRGEAGSVVRREADRRLSPAADLSVPQEVLSGENQPAAPTEE